MVYYIYIENMVEKFDIYFKISNISNTIGDGTEEKIGRHPVHRQDP